MAWRGNFDLPPTSTFDPNSLPQRKMYKIHQQFPLIALSPLPLMSIT
jgi:hypothetical protein